MFDLSSYIEARCHLVNARLDQLLPPEQEPPAVLHKAMRYMIFPGGKRIRPVLCMAAAEAVGANAESAILPAASLEILHTYTLIHDDLPCMDDDSVRRGKATAHVAFGEANALLAGDALQALAFEVAASAPVPSACPPNRLVTELAFAAGSRGVVGGQVEDLAALRNIPTLQQMDFIHLHKTADLFRAAIRMGAIAGNANSADLDSLTRYGSDLGVAFQITDDLLDAATDSQSGACKKATSCLSVCSVEDARTRAEDLIRSATHALASFPPQRVAPLLAIADFVLHRRE